MPIAICLHHARDPPVREGPQWIQTVTEHSQRRQGSKGRASPWAVHERHLPPSPKISRQRRALHPCSIPCAFASLLMECTAGLRC